MFISERPSSDEYVDEGLCIVANYAFLSEGNPNFPEFGLISEEFGHNSDEWSSWDSDWSSSGSDWYSWQHDWYSWDSYWRKRIINNENRTRYLSDDMSGLGWNHFLLLILRFLTLDRNLKMNLQWNQVDLNPSSVADQLCLALMYEPSCSCESNYDFQDSGRIWNFSMKLS